MSKLRTAARALRDHQPHIYGAGAILSAAASAAAQAAGVAALGTVLDTSVVLAIVSLVFVGGFFGTLWLRARK